MTTTVGRQVDQHRLRRLCLRPTGIPLRSEEGGLSRGHMGDLDKMRMAQRLRDETMVTLGWIAGRLSMKSVAFLTRRPYLPRQRKRE